MNWFHDLTGNPFLMTAISSWFIAQTLKVILYAVINKRFEIERFFGDGGMPSAHSATVVSLAVISGLLRGLGSFEFGATFIFAVIVCRDAMGVRLEAGKHAQLINEIVKTFEMLTSETLPVVKLKEFVGHTPLQVLGGTLIGIVNAIVMYNVFT